MNFSYDDRHTICRPVSLFPRAAGFQSAAPQRSCWILDLYAQRQRGQNRISLSASCRNVCRSPVRSSMTVKRSPE